MKQYRLPKEFADKWLAALRSEEYKQGKENLFMDGCYCCLGIAGRLCGYTENELDRSGLLTVGSFPNVPPELYDGEGFDHLHGKLVIMNDNGKPFPEIADWIEQNVELY